MASRPFGYHIAGGTTVGSSLDECARTHRFSAAQIFLGPPQQYRTSPVSPLQRTQFLHVKLETGIKVYVHAPYVLHAFAKPENAKRNNAAVAEALNVAASLQCDGYVLHMGGTKWYEADQYESVLGDLLSVCSGPLNQIPLLLENCASGNPMSGELPLICNMIRTFRKRGYDLNLCLDTCHAFAFGYDLMDPEILDFVVNTVRPELRLLHLNSIPTKVACGCKLDRHESIYSGAIPVSVFQRLLVCFPDVPCIAERDSFEDVKNDRAFVEAIDSLSYSSTLKPPTPMSEPISMND